MINFQSVKKFNGGAGVSRYVTEMVCVKFIRQTFRDIRKVRNQIDHIANKHSADT